jgi:hypothetical protein
VTLATDIQEKYSMSTTRRLGQRWNDDELIVVLDLHLNQGLSDGHHHNSIAKCLGRYSPRTNSYKDGPVNQKLAEVIGERNITRARRHAGSRIIELLGKYAHRRITLRADAVKAWQRVLREHTGKIPPEVQDFLN